MTALTGRISLVTGAASGIGRATTARLVTEGATVVALDWNETALDELAEAIPVTMRIVADVASPSQVEAALNRAEHEIGPLELVVASAGIADDEPVTEGDPTHWHHVMDVNANGVMNVLGRAAARMAPRGRGDLVAVASVSSRITYTGQPAYIASKHAVWAFMDVLRQELAATGVRVTTLQPGLVDTPLSRPATAVADHLSDVQPLAAHDCADAIAYAVTREPSVSVNEIILRPTGQLL